MTSVMESGRIDEKLLEESLEELYENAPCGYVSTLPDGTFAKVNQTLLRWTGYDREELLAGKRFQDLLPIAGKIYYETHYAPLLQMQGFVNEVAFDLICRDGRQLPVLLNATQKRARNGAALLNRITLFNATDRRRYERELLQARRKAEEASQAKARFLSMLGHEIRTPLSAITLAAQALERFSQDPRQARYIRILTSSSQNLLELVNDILDYSRIEAGTVTLDEKRFDLRQLVTDLVIRQEARAEQKNLALQVEVDDQLPQAVVGDPVKLGQVLTNLVSNAVKFTATGYVKLCVHLKERRANAVLISFSVEDTGIGIRPERLPHIFEEFTQASPEIAASYGGTGLGLAISRKLLQLYDSTIEVTSTPDVGSTFSFTICLETA